MSNVANVLRDLGREGELFGIKTLPSARKEEFAAAAIAAAANTLVLTNVSSLLCRQTGQWVVPTAQAERDRQWDDRSERYGVLNVSAIESAARFAGWVKAAVEDTHCWEAQTALRLLLPVPQRGVGSAGNNAEWLLPLMQFVRSPRTMTWEEVKGLRRAINSPLNGVALAANGFSRKWLGLLGRLNRFAADALICWLLGRGYGSLNGLEIVWVEGGLAWRDVPWALVARVKGAHGARRALASIPEDWRKDQMRDSIARHEFRAGAGFWSKELFEKFQQKRVKPADLRVLFEGVPGQDLSQGGLGLAVVRLLALFTASQAAEYVRNQFPDTTSSDVHDAGQFDFPEGGGWTRAAWVSILATGKISAKALIFAADVEEHLGRAPASAEEVELVMSQMSLGALSDNAVATYAHATGYTMSASVAKDYVEFFDKNPNKRGSNVPSPVVPKDGEYRLVQLDSNDMSQVWAGELTDCCQHLHNAGRSCAAHAWTSPDSAIWAVFKGRSMIAQSWVWRADDTLVVDSLEALRNVNKARVLALMEKAIQDVVGHRRLCVSTVVVADTSAGITRHLAKSNAEKRHYEAPTSYSDARYGAFVHAEVEPVTVEVTFPVSSGLATCGCCEVECQVCGVTFQDIPEDVNVLMNGSDVFCEHCNAEVHPDCEVCPSCGENISEWVD